MSKKNQQPIEESQAEHQPVETVAEAPQPVQRTKQYTFPDIAHGGPAVAIDATSIEEATALFRKGQA